MQPERESLNLDQDSRCDHVEAVGRFCPVCTRLKAEKTYRDNLARQLEKSRNDPPSTQKPSDPTDDGGEARRKWLDLGKQLKK